MIIRDENGFTWTLIYKDIVNGYDVRRYAVTDNEGYYSADEDGFVCDSRQIEYVRYATGNEKEQLLKEMKENNHMWNAESKKIEKIEEDKPKLNPNTLQPFDKVLVKEEEEEEYWTGDLFLYFDNSSSYQFVGIQNSYKCCIPFNDETKHLLGTDKEAPEFYRL